MLIEIVVAVSTLCAFLYYKIIQQNDYWTKLGVKQMKPAFFFGNFGDVAMQKKSMHDLFKESYQQFRNEKIYGIYMFTEPTLVINDPEIAKVILVKEFNNFVNRDDPVMTKTMFGPGKADKVFGNQLSMMAGDEWKDVRTTFSPIFTSGKMKVMFKFIDYVGENLLSEFDKLHTRDEEFELKEVWGKFSLDSIASCAFGVDAECLKNPNSEFAKNAAELFKFNMTKMFAVSIIPGLYTIMEFLNISVTNPKETQFFVDVVKQTLKSRMETKTRRNDLVDMMMDAIKEDGIKVDENANEEDQYDKDMRLDHLHKTKQLDEMVIVGTAMTLLIAGYDTTGMLLSWIGWELAKSPEIQAKLQQEIDDAFDDNNENMPHYNNIQNLPYLDQVIHEALRLHPILPIQRHCMNDFNIPGTGVTLKKGQTVFINTWGIQTDSKYFPNPETFNPDNFSKEAKATRSPYTFLTFGQGPRACIGMRFALLEAKVGLVATLRKYSFVRSAKTQDTVEIDPENILAYAKGGLWVKVEKRL